MSWATETEEGREGREERREGRWKGDTEGGVREGEEGKGD